MKNEHKQLIREIVNWLISESIDTLRDSASDRLYPGWHYLRWYPESLEEMEKGNFGKVIKGIEASPCYPESEYFGKGNHPITFWQETISCSWAHPDCGLEWEPCDREEARYISGPYQIDWAPLDSPEAVMKLAEKNLGDEFETQEKAEEALIKAGAYYFYLGEPIDGIDTSYLEETLETIVSNRIEMLVSNQ